MLQPQLGVNVDTTADGLKEIPEVTLQTWQLVFLRHHGCLVAAIAGCLVSACGQGGRKEGRQAGRPGEAHGRKGPPYHP